MEWLSPCWFVKYMENHAWINTIHGHLKNNFPRHSHISESQLWNCGSILLINSLGYLNHTTQLFTKLFRTKLGRIGVLIIISFIKKTIDVWFTKETSRKIYHLHISAFIIYVDLVTLESLWCQKFCDAHWPPPPPKKKKKKTTKKQKNKKGKQI